MTVMDTHCHTLHEVCSPTLAYEHTLHYCPLSKATRLSSVLHSMQARYMCGSGVCGEVLRCFWHAEGVTSPSFHVVLGPCRSACVDKAAP